ncbi:MAG: ATP-dependent transcriptional regulator [Lachnospiraceae bacterium]|jgi:LuxR family maltose regulon positive regulatory protein|nr:ATP-dependent transcriptional regulator [Lachnospiraceae bacterium]
MKKQNTYNTEAIYLTDKFKNQMKMVLNYPCTIVEAPMGYGKTTGVREYLKKEKVRVLWQKIHDNSVSGFWISFCKLFKEADTACYERMQQIGLPSDSVTKEKVLGLIADVLDGEQTVLVLDDFHLVDNPDINSFIEYLLWNELSNCHMILTVRYTRFDSLEELILKGYIYYIQKNALEFTIEEIISYYRQCGISLRESDGHWLYSYTEGWVSALYLLMLNFREEGHFTAPTNITKLIEKTVYLPFSHEIKKFLLCISFFDVFTLEQAAYMWQKDNTLELLEVITGRNAFINRDEKTKIYQVHKMFQEFLRDIFQELKQEDKEQFYLQAAKWYLEAGDYIASMQYFYQGNDFNNLLFALEVDKGYNMVNEHREKLITYMEKCPGHVRQEHPVAMLVYALCLFSYNDMERFSQVCDEISSILKNSRDIQFAQELEGELEIILIFKEYNDIEKMYARIRKACSLLNRPAEFMDTRGGWTFGSPSVLYMFYREAGKLKDTLLRIKEAMPYYDKLVKGHGMGADYVMEAEKYYYMGDLNSAEITVHKAIYLASSHRQKDILLCAVFLQARIALCKGDYSSIKNEMKKQREEMEQEQWYHLFHTLDLCEAFLYASLGRKQEIPQWITSGDFNSSSLYFPAVAFLNIVYGRVLLIRGEYHKLLGSVDYFTEIASVFPNLLGQIYTCIFTAGASERLLRRDKAISELKQALELALSDGLLMPFVENCDYIRPLLQELYQKNEYREQIKEIFQLYKPYQQSIEEILEKNFLKSEPKLTEREAQIAQLVAGGLSNQEIGSRLYITQNTVKTILKSIFKKLGITSRAMLKQFIDLQV